MYGNKIYLKSAQEFVDFIDEHIRKTVRTCIKIGADWRKPKEHLENLKNSYLETNEFSQCYSCNKVFEEPNQKFCSDECKQAEILEVA